MVPVFLTALLLSLPQQPDSTTFRDAATAELYARARVRHIQQDSLVRDYRATVRTRLDATAGRSRFARQTTLVAHESVAEVSWEAPNNLRVKVLGARARAPIVRIVQGFGGDVEAEAESELREDLVMDRPWFIPRAMGDSVRLMGVPEHAALHPLADSAIYYYRFAITDSLSIMVPDRTVRVLKLRVEPKVYGPSLVAGDMWIDAETADVVRFGMVFVGDYIWDSPRNPTAADSARARKENAEANRFLTVEAMVEYALVDRLYWMPYRKLLSITAEIPWFLNIAIPARAVTTFSDYRINGNRPIAFRIPKEQLVEAESGKPRLEVKVRVGGQADTGWAIEEKRERNERYERGYYRAGIWNEGRWEMEIPPADSLRAFQWSAELDASYDGTEERRLRETFAELSELEEDLPLSWTGRRRFNLAWQQAAEIVRFNRVQGLSLGMGGRLRTGIRFSSLLVSGRFSLSDLRPTGSLTWRREGPAGRLDLAAYRTVAEPEPWTRGIGIGNSLNALVVGHDDADYFLRSGGAIAYTWNYGPLSNVELRLAYERHETMDVETGSVIADMWGVGAFRPNPPVVEGWFFRGAVGRQGRMGIAGIASGAEWVAGEGLVGGRAWGSVEIPFALLGFGGSVQARAGVMRGDSLPQLLYRLGGPQTVRGYEYGTRTGREFWAGRLDLALSRSRLLAPVAFVDIGDTFSSDPLIGAGGGISLLNGIVRFNLSWGLRPSSDARFDLLFRAPR